MRYASEETRIRPFVLVDPFPLEVIGQRSRVYYIETLGVFDLSAQGLELNDAVLGLDVWLFLAVSRRGQLKVANGSLGLSVELKDQFLLVWVEILDRDDKQSFISLLNFSRRKPDGENFITVRVNGSGVRGNSKESSIDLS